ncbi:MAG: hypothetical protein ACYCU7_06090 [Acidimicrobiales bacterium]
MSDHHPSLLLPVTPVHLGRGAITVPQERFTGVPACHTGDVGRTTTVLLITPGLGTENRPR